MIIIAYEYYEIEAFCLTHLSALFKGVVLSMVHANGDEVPSKPPLPSMSYPLFLVAMNDQHISIEFQTLLLCEISYRNTILISHMLLFVENFNYGAFVVVVWVGQM